MSVKDELFRYIDSHKEEMIERRRHLHENPELSFHEDETAQYLAEFYQDKAVSLETGIGERGLKVTIDSGRPGKTVALRADFDALPIEEATGLPFASKNKGVMHACGHDGHTAYLMTLAEAFLSIKDQLKGKIVLIHQPAEEMPPGGALQMIKDGVLDGVDNVFGAHVMTSMKLGTVAYHHGETQNSRARFKVTVRGKGGHGSSPHEANDAIVIACQLVIALQNIVSRRLSPFENGVVTIGSFDGKGSFNVIKETVTIEGDVRAMSEETASTIEKNVKEICAGIASAYHCEIDCDYVRDYPVLYNDPEMTDLVIDAIQKADIPEVTDLIDCGPQAPSEDFSYFAKERPSCFFYIGATREGETAYPHHHPKFDIDEDCLVVAAKAMGAVALHYLEID